MYIDFHKYNYELVNQTERAQFIERDKEGYKNVLRKWIETNLESIVNRKWEIDEITYVSEVSDFIKLIREAESLFELGFYTSCIALVGVAAEDFTKYLAIKLGKPNYEHLTQYVRTQNLRNDGLINITIYDLLDRIRTIRNDCLHYNDNFKLKNESQLKSEAIEGLNNLKGVIKTILGISNSPNIKDYPKLITEIIENLTVNAKNFDETTMKIRNATSFILNFPIAFSPEQKIEDKTDYFVVKEIDIENFEITLTSVFLHPGLPVIVDLKDTDIEHVKNINLKEKNTVFASIYSEINSFGMTTNWNILNLLKIDNFSDIIHDLLKRKI